MKYMVSYLFGLLLLCSEFLLSEEARMFLCECMHAVNFSTRSFFEKW